MIGLLIFLLRLLVPFKPKLRLEAENAALRQQLRILQRKLRGRVQLTNGNRLFFLQLYRWFPSLLKTKTIVQPDTVVRWHREGFGLVGRARLEAGSRSARDTGADTACMIAAQ